MPISRTSSSSCPEAVPPQSTPLSRWAANSRLRLGLFGAVALSAVYIGFIGLDVTMAEWLIKRSGYHFMWFTVLWWVVALVRLVRGQIAAAASLAGPAPWCRKETFALAAIVLVVSGAHLGMETLRSKILYDEFVLQSTAYNMHHFREVATMVRGYDLLGTFVSTDNYLDKRPYFYPFLISMAHDFTGYRPLNAYLLNVVLMPVGLGLAYILGRRWHGWRGGMLAVGLLGSLPLYGQNATGAGMEMLNLIMLLLAVLTGTWYLERSAGGSLAAFVLTVVLLAQCRYESALYVLPAALVILVGWARSGRLVLPGAALAAPLLLLPVALHNRVLSESPVLWEMKAEQTSRFGWQYVADNARGVLEYWFSLSWRLSNSVLLAVLGLAALAVCGVWLLWRRPSWRRLDAQAVVWLIFSTAIGANLVLVLFYFWSRFTDPMASRFSLPAYLLMTFAGVVLVRWLDRRGPATVVVLALVGLSFLGTTVPKASRHLYSRVGIDEMEWERRFVASLPPKTRLVLSNKTTVFWLLDKTPSILLDRAVLMQDRLAYQLTQPTFQEILVSQSLRPASVDGDFQVVPEERLPPAFRLEALGEKRFGTRLARISRLVAIDIEGARQATPASASPDE